MDIKDIYNDLLSYDIETGNLFWKFRDRKWFDCEAEFKRWNGRFPGKRALTGDNGKGYKVGAILSKRVSSHRVVWEMHFGKIPEGMQIDHVNGVRDDNRIENLRLVTCSQNNKNRKAQKTSTGKMGVHFRRDNSMWRAIISHEGNCMRLGQYKTYEEAVLAREAAEVSLGYHSNHGRIT